MKIHDQVLGLGVPVADLALVAVWVPGHLLWYVTILLVLLQQLVILILNLWACLQGLAQNLTCQPSDGNL